jgi:hypothetical protein
LLLLSSSSSSSSLPFCRVFTITHYPWNKPCFYGEQCFSYSIVTIYETRNVISRVECCVRLRYYFLKYQCSAKYGCFLQFVDFGFSWYFAQVFSEWLCDISSCSYYFWFIIIIIIINFLLITLATSVILSVPRKWLLGVPVRTCSSVLRPTLSRNRSSRY